jgi:acyl-CoA thioesterase 8
MHCYFVLAGDATIPVLYYVEHVREGKSFATRTVQARQRGKCIFTTTMSFVRENSGGPKTVNHQTPWVDTGDCPPDERGEDDQTGQSPFESVRCEMRNKDSPEHGKRTRQWIRARGKISESGGHQAHLSALAYMSDSYFIGTVSRVHNLWRFPTPKLKPGATNSGPQPNETRQEETIRKVKEMEGFGQDLNNEAKRPEIGMMVSLDHSIYFHEPRRVRADEWMFTEMESPWAGDGRGVVCQKMWARDGTHVATCFQEGVVRLKAERDTKL